MLKYILIASVLLAFPCFANAQQDQEATRDLWDTAFIKKRPEGKGPVKRANPIHYKIVGKTTLPASKQTATGSAVVGVTVWRLRPSKATDDQEVRQLIYEQGEWTPERVNAGEPLSEGSRVQLTIESPRAGYLYVFDREQYADKSYGEPYLIFPILALNGGDNRVSAGRIIEIPSPQDKPSYYTLKRSRSDHDGEALTVIVSDKPLSDLTIGRGALKVSTEQFNSYEAKWGVATQQLELENGAGTAMSKAEKNAASGKGALTQNDSLPQTIYRLSAKPNQPLLITIPLAIGGKSEQTSNKSEP
jgi:Domain of unknown function (DUF4384)